MLIYLDNMYIYIYVCIYTLARSIYPTTQMSPSSNNRICLRRETVKKGTSIFHYGKLISNHEINHEVRGLFICIAGFFWGYVGNIANLGSGFSNIS